MASAPSKGVLHEDLQRKISLKYSSAVYIYLTVLSYTDQANNFPGPSEVCPGFVRTILFFSCKNSDLHLIFALVARKRGKRKNCPNTQTMCYKLSVLFDIKTLGQSKTGINFFETLTSDNPLRFGNTNTPGMKNSAQHSQPKITIYLSFMAALSRSALCSWTQKSPQ